MGLALPTEFVRNQREFNDRVGTFTVSTGDRVDGMESRIDGLTAKVDGLRDDTGLGKGAHARTAMRQNLDRVADEFSFEFISEVPQAAVIGFSKPAAAREKLQMKRSASATPAWL